MLERRSSAGLLSITEEVPLVDSSVDQRVDADVDEREGQPSGSEEPAVKRARKGFSCDLCDTTFTEKRALTRHLQTNQHRKRSGLPARELYPCSSCSRSFSRDYDRSRHENEIHRGIRRQDVVSKPPVQSQTPQILELCQDISDENPQERNTTITMAAAVVHPNNDHATRAPPSVTSQDTFCESKPTGDSASDSAIDLGYQRPRARTPPALTPEVSQNRNTGTDPTERFGSTVQHRSVMQRHGRTKISPPRSRLFCAFCDLPYEDLLQDLMTHLRQHLDELKGSLICNGCQVGFVHQQDLEMHRQAVATEGRCGFSFQHQSQCTGHHPMEAEDMSLELSDWDSFRLCTQLRGWEQSQLKAYMASISDLVTSRSRKPKDIDSYSIEVLYRQSCASLASFAISVKTFASAPCDKSESETGRDVRGLQGRLRTISLWRSRSRQGGTAIPRIDTPPVTLQTMLHKAVRTGDISMAKRALECGANANDVRIGGEYPLFVAIDGNNLAMFKVLLTFGAHHRCCKGNTFMSSAIVHATRLGRSEMVSILFDSGESSLDGLHAGAVYAAADIRAETIKTLQKAGYNIDTSFMGCSSMLWYAVSSNDISAAETLLQSGANVSFGCKAHGDVLIGAVGFATKTMARLLIAWGAEVNNGPQCQTPICRALRRQSLEMMDLLLQTGARLTTCRCTEEVLWNPVVNKHVLRHVLGDESLKVSFLSAVVAKGEKYSIGAPTYDLSTTANESNWYFKWNLLGLAVSKKDVWATQILLEHGVPPIDHADVLNAPLGIAVSYGNAQLVDLLIHHHAWTGRLSDYADIAERKGNQEVVELLHAYVPGSMV